MDTTDLSRLWMSVQVAMLVLGFWGVLRRQAGILERGRS
jgi:hypothetical protein